MKIPKYIEKLLQRRRNLALDLLGVCEEVDKYCERIGVDMCNENNALCSDVRIYCEPDAAYSNTKSAIEKVLKEREYNV